jgi:hypothetical protein
MVYVYRALALLVILAAMPYPVVAQFGGMPGMPGMGAPGAGAPGMGAPGFVGAPAAPPPACQQLLAMRDETQKSANAIQKASDKKAGPDVACKLFKVFLATEAKMIKGIETNAQLCGVPPEMPKQMKVGHAKAQQIAKQICDAAARGPALAPSLSEALGVTTGMPEAQAKPGGAFDTLSGNVLSR